MDFAQVRRLNIHLEEYSTITRRDSTGHIDCHQAYIGAFTFVQDQCTNGILGPC